MVTSDSELTQHLKEQLLWILLLRKNIEVESICFNNIYYCAKCYKDKKEVIILRKTRDEPSIFNCPYCSSLKKYDNN